MRREWLEGIIVGIIIGLLVTFIRALVLDAPESQIIGLATAAVVLAIVQVALVLRHIRHDATTRATSRSTFLRRAASRRDPFDREASQSWTGLVERAPDGLPPGSADSAAHKAPEDGS